jgi:hypothetical protein
MEALSRGLCDNREPHGIGSHNSEGNEESGGHDDRQLVTVGPRAPPISPVFLTKVRLQGFIGKLSAHCPSRNVGHMSSLKRLETGA